MKFHTKEGLSFERGDDGSVIVEKRRSVFVDGVEREAIDTVTLPPELWAGAVASVSARAGTDEVPALQSEVLEFHMSTARSEG